MATLAKQLCPPKFYRMMNEVPTPTPIPTPTLIVIVIMVIVKPF